MKQSKPVEVIYKGIPIIKDCASDGKIFPIRTENILRKFIIKGLKYEK